MSTETASKPEKPKTDKNLKVTVAAPRHPKPKKYTFKTQMLVGAAADEVAEDFGYATGTPTFQNSSEDLLDRTKSLHDEGVQDGDEFELVDVGGGV